MQYRNKWGTNWMILAFSLLVVGYFAPAESRAAAESHNEAFSSVKKRLITDGFDPAKIKRLYSRPQVFFEAGWCHAAFYLQRGPCGLWPIHK